MVVLVCDGGISTQADTMSSLTHLIDVNHCACLLCPKGHNKPHNEVSSESLVEQPSQLSRYLLD